MTPDWAGGAIVKPDDREVDVFERRDGSGSRRGVVMPVREATMADSKVRTIGGSKLRVVRLRRGPEVEKAYAKTDAAFGKAVRKLATEREQRVTRAEEAAANFLITH